MQQQDKQEQSARQILESDKNLILDGALGTMIEAGGRDINDVLWSGKFLLEDPSVIQDIHLKYFEAGADVAITSTYNVSLPGFLEKGLTDEEAQQKCALSCEIAAKARDEFWADEKNRQGRVRPLVAASIGSYGAFLPTGEEFTGDYKLTEKEYMDWHRWMIKACLKGKPDLFAIETHPRLDEIQAICKLFQTEFPD